MTANPSQPHAEGPNYLWASLLPLASHALGRAAAGSNAAGSKATE